VRASVRPRRTNTLLFGVFAALGLMLSALGVYAVVAYGVAQRSRELRIRVALGATGRDLLTLDSQDMIVTLAIGVVIGLGAAWGSVGCWHRCSTGSIPVIQPRSVWCRWRSCSPSSSRP